MDAKKEEEANAGDHGKLLLAGSTSALGSLLRLKAWRPAMAWTACVCLVNKMSGAKIRVAIKRLGLTPHYIKCDFLIENDRKLIENFIF